ncbi:alpha/beta hydrolase [Clostridium estertheticum]|uniref:alpha/beta hydrolase n=1 Tax=Clostridium estertheticum TaxID=238834 RepID=UPI001C7CECE5|nr:alpha/beta hydrolase [Clostridium estertheticum]MBX4270034.1 alpha/beta hydrolase [Clostridium estertheticum]WLC80241.1 alpha/beta hydrolase [Clostridium estertheticum]
MENSKYSDLVEILKNKTIIEKANGIDITIKQIPDLDENGVMDPRVYKVLTEPEVKKDKEKDNFVFNGYPVGEIRQSMGWDNKDITTREIRTEYRTIKGQNGDIPVRIYTPLENKGKFPCLIFFHGGGFIGGTLDVVENPCKAIADKANAVVISVDYRLAPENPFPKGFIDCFDAVKYAYNNSKELNIHKEKICVSGDSAGGNLAAGCSLKDRNEKTNMIKYQALIYPVVILTNNKGEEYKWNISQYNIKNNDEIIKKAVLGLRDDSMVEDLYAQGENIYISPLLEKDFGNLPKTIVINAEYDFLRVQGEVYVKKLIDAGVDARNIRYNGIDHAFIDKCGIYPQAEDCFNEIAKDIRDL